MTDSGPNPTVRRRILASELRRLRVEAGMTQQQAEEACGLGRASLSRYESCVSSIAVPACEKLLTIYGVEGDRVAALLDLARGARRRGWLNEFRGTIPEWFEDLVALERDASSIRELALQYVPGLLQTERYARAILTAGVLDLDVDGLVRARVSRAEILDRERPPEYRVVLCESALDCLVGGRAVMRKQLEHLAALARRPNITVRLLPNERGAHPSMTTPFVLLGFDLAPDFGVAYLDYLTGSLYRDEPDEVAQYDRAYRRLLELALPEARSLELITGRAEELV